MVNDQEIIKHRLRQDVFSASGNGGCGSGLFEPGRIIAASPAMRDILKVVRRTAPTDTPVLIHGEPDTGKRLIACEVHGRSRRAAGPFVHVACGALRESDVAEKLFGRGEHRVARDNQAQMPLLAEASGGTLFLEDIAQLPLWGQVSLLEVLQLGRHPSDARLPGLGVDVRVIASTTVDLHTVMTQGGFLSSLYYFLKVVEIRVPPLRHRPRDIGPLAEIYLAGANATRVQYGKRRPCHFAKETLQCLAEYGWPGNTLQLASVVVHAALLTDGDEIWPMHVQKLLGEVVPQDHSETISVPLIGGLKEMERAIVKAVIKRCKGNKTEAARVLGLHRRTLYRVLHDEGPAKESTTHWPPTVGPSLHECTVNAHG